MITVQLNRQNFEYDVHSLVKAFYPEEDVQITYALSAEAAASNDSMQNQRKAPEEETVPSLRLVISFVGDEADTEHGEGRISVVFSDADGNTVLEDGIPMNWSTDRKEVKNELKRLMYRMLSAYTGQQLPWGNLTGIRPTKIPMALLEQGWKNSEIAQYMRDTYYTSNE